MVTEKTIQNCFAHGGFTAKNEEMLNPLHDVEVPSNMIPESFEDVVDQDADAPVVGELTDAEILEATQQSKKARLENEIDETEEELDVEPPLVDLLNSLTNLRKFSQKSGLSASVLNSLHTIEKQISKERVNRTSQQNIQTFSKCV